MCVKLSKEALGGGNLQHMKKLLIYQKEVGHLDDDDDDIEEIRLPPPLMGRDKTKARAIGEGKATSSNSTVRTERSARSEEMITQMTQLISTLERHMIETIRLTEYTLLMQDVRHLDAEDQETAKAVKQSIRGKYKLNRK
ncbi:unnamed protein product [Lactuca virosa]|uniref:Uncharacterized protein n=1 Tax=Lactuca virosa TaxID=75947 RepID=A0AAU9LBX8_9ASTR|nr:unnamed protein product [Lactuca virosa]